ncbi:MAG: hypothetical protein M3T55_00755 [Pseudomonadota bacterium]|nr:hypothetical protein [Pseudomonadota bacterium]
MSSTSVFSSVGGLAAGICLVCAGGTALAQQAPRAPDTERAVPRFAVLPATHPELAVRTSGGLTTWNFAYNYQGSNYNETFVGNAPSGAASTTPSFVIPLKLIVSGQTFSTSTIQSNGKSALTDTTSSPIFQSEIDFQEAGVNLGTTQYIDAYERESFWPTVAGNPGYHVLLGAPTVLPEVTLRVPRSSGHVGTEFGVRVALVDINYIDSQINNYLAAHSQITAASIPVFETYNTYLTSGGCCIGGYHSANGAQSYMQFSYIGKSGAFAQDVSALSHEMGEWLSDPFTVNNSPCGIYENGDPLENEPNYGDYAYVVGGLMTYHLQDLAQPPYFGAPASTTLNGRATFQGTSLSVCQNGA